MTLNPKSFHLQIGRGVATITLDRPERLNALTFEVYKELETTFRSLEHCAEARVVLITGRGRGFCSGGDVEGIIAELFGRDVRAQLEFTRMTGALIQSICELRRPVIAAVNGVAVGAGAVIAAACDLRVAAESARFGFIFPKVGLSGADMGASYLLPRILGQGRAAELLYFGDLVGSQEALRIGLVNRVVPDEDLLSTARAWADRLARGPAFAHAMTKQMLDSERGMTLSLAIEAEAQAQALCMAHPDFREAYDANREKRPPRFEGAEICDEGLVTLEVRAGQESGAGQEARVPEARVQEARVPEARVQEARVQEAPQGQPSSLVPGSGGPARVITEPPPTTLEGAATPPTRRA
ncbi:Enoyl-CoA hydratase [Chondromyces apiculatus DSM 436]|uniref:Enoyl-CoA hydratase n=1 Tax=Chondromyces apiculatus DSM 436 TaxID=1192034 RepID=A0A017STN3_9BACT|nr:enoyl-CoA hydratase family protein [Chondromyces apiculatus]EYF00334.1 Enoyl-CoA hydratase [Chondromyces apiculatus DSM 436]